MTLRRSGNVVYENTNLRMALIRDPIFSIFPSMKTEEYPLDELVLCDRIGQLASNLGMQFASLIALKDQKVILRTGSESATRLVSVTLISGATSVDTLLKVCKGLPLFQTHCDHTKWHSSRTVLPQ